ncbi:MAG: hypothetical protein ACREME_02165 [Gemmatimonadales bacterium]
MDRPGRRAHVIRPALLLAAALMLAGTAAVEGAGSGVKPPPKKARAADFEIRPLVDGGPGGSGNLRQKRRRLRGNVTVTGLEPGTVHAWNLVGPRGRCHRQVSRYAVSPDDLVADANGVASAKLRERAPESVVRRGYYLLIQQHSSTGPPPPPDEGGGGGILPGLLPSLFADRRARHPGHPNPGIACGDVR